MEKHVARAYAALTANRAVRRVTVFLSPTLTIKLTRKLPLDKRDRGTTYLLTVGKPNWHERQRIKVFKRAKEPFPVKKVQLTFYAKKKA